MNTKILSIIVVFLMTTSLFSQTSLNNYKYIIIPKKYDFLKEADRFQLNSLTEFLFNKYGFQAFMEDGDYPQDLDSNRCLALTSHVKEDSSLFKTKLQIELKNCNGLTIYTTQVGETREKDFNKAYPEALRLAFKELETINYKYVPTEKSSVQVEVQTNNETGVVNHIAELKAEIENLKQDKEKQMAVIEEPKEVVSIVEAPKTAASNENASGVLYAQAIENGFQLVDRTPMVVYKIKNTSLQNVFMVEGKNATLYKKGDHWIMEYYDNDVLKQDVLNIKF